MTRHGSARHRIPIGSVSPVPKFVEDISRIVIVLPLVHAVQYTDTDCHRLFGCLLVEIGMVLYTELAHWDARFPLPGIGVLFCDAMRCDACLFDSIREIGQRSIEWSKATEFEAVRVCLASRSNRVEPKHCETDDGCFV